MAGWRQASDKMRAALRESVVPDLRARGFKGSFPHFSRKGPERLDLLTFQFSLYGPDLYIEVGSCPVEGAVGPGGSLVPAEKVRVHHAGPFRRRIGPQPSLDFSGIGDSVDASSLIAQISSAITNQGESWWANPQSVFAT